MSNDKHVYVHELVVKFECDENNVVNWIISTDDAVNNTLDADYEELARAGAPLSALGIRVLRDLLGDGIIDLALDRANNYVWRRYFEQHAEVCGVTSNDAAAQWLAQHDGLDTVQ
jgi:hypothetical protein